MSDKPVYRVPTMEEIRAIPPNGYTAVSTFSGAGGSCTGYRMVGFRVLWASEFIDAAAETYAANHPETILDRRDIREVSGADILAACGLHAGELDLLDGSPPCAAFSTAGKREEGWGKVKPYSDKSQRVDDLFFEYVRLLRELQPKTFIAENVSGLVKGTSKGYFKEILKELRGAGYAVYVKLLDAQWLGVPQMRQRIIFMGIRNDLAALSGVEPAFPKPLSYRYTVRDAIGPLLAGETVIHGSGGQFVNHGDVTDRPAPTIRGGGKTAHNGQIDDFRVIHDTRGGFSSGGDVTDRPAPTVKAGGDLSNGGASRDFRVVHDTSGLFSQGDVTDRPCPAITNGKGGLNAYHFQVEDDDPPEDLRISARVGPQFQRVPVDPDAPCNAIIASAHEQRFEVEPESSIAGFAIEREWEKLKPGESSERYYMLTRSAEDGPSPTVTAIGGHSGGTAGVTHPTERRKFSIAELKRICAFPDDYVLTGSYAQQWERCGRAVPPVMMYHIAKTVVEDVLDRLPR